MVPSPTKRAQVSLDTHRGIGYFGVQPVLDPLQKNYWWRGMGYTVVAVIKARLPCARVKVGFRESSKELQSLHVRGLWYRWGVGLANPLETTLGRSPWIMVCIELISGADYIDLTSG